MFQTCENVPNSGYNSLYDFNFIDCSPTPDYCLPAGSNCTVTNCIDLADLATLLSTFGAPCECYSTLGFAAASAESGGDATDGDGGTDDAFVGWIRGATIEEILAWFEQYQQSQ